MRASNSPGVVGLGAIELHMEIDDHPHAAGFQAPTRDQPTMNGSWPSGAGSPSDARAGSRHGAVSSASTSVLTPSAS